MLYKINLLKFNLDVFFGRHLFEDEDRITLKI